MNEGYEYRPVEEVKTEGNFVKAITFKPYFAIIVCALIGILLLIVSNIYARLMGAFFILLSLFVFKGVKDYKVMDIFDRGVMIYGDRENRTACFISFDDVEEWTVNRDNGTDTVEFTLSNGQKIGRNTFAAGKAYTTLYSLLKEKEKQYLKAQNSKSLSIPEAFENLRNRFMNRR